MKFITITLVFNFIWNCWPKYNLVHQLHKNIKWKATSVLFEITEPRHDLHTVDTVVPP